MAKPARPDLETLIEFNLSMPIVRYRLARGYIDLPVRCRIADEALCHAEALQADHMLVILPSNHATTIRHNGHAWRADSGDTLEQIQSDLDLHMRSAIRQRAEATQARPNRAGRLDSMRHARCDVAELLQIQHFGWLLSAWRQIRQQAMVSMPYRLSLANELGCAQPAANLNRHLVHILRARMAAIQAWSPALAIQQAEQHLGALKSVTSRYEREWQWKNLRLCAQCHPAYRMLLQEALAVPRQPERSAGVPRQSAPARDDPSAVASHPAMRP